MEARRVGDDGDEATAEHRFQLSEGGVGREGLQFVGHHAGDRLAEACGVLVHPQQNVRFVDHADQLFAFHQHGQLRDIRQAHALEGS